ncbi:MAG: hypothetical protein HPY45_00265 [Anaerolineae bacterium]|nr:hypothetical protein [Anaerolineae bacterium]
MKREGILLVIALLMLLLIACACPASGLGKQLDNLRELQGAASTVEALATEVGSEGLASTAQAMLTEVPLEGLQGTLEVLMPTEMNNPENLQATMQAMLPQPDASQSKPEDIPVWGGTKENFYADSSAVSYLTPDPFSDIIAFYKNEMPANGWEAVKVGSVETADAAVLQYKKIDRSAIVTLSRSNDKTVVQVTISTP